MEHRVTYNLEPAEVSKTTINEATFQKLLEKYRFPGATHKRVACGVTDITTDTLHAEIKRFDFWKEAIGQLMAYKVVMHRSELQLYLFGRVSQACKDMAIHVLQSLNIHPFEMILTDTEFIIVDLLNKSEQSNQTHQIDQEAAPDPPAISEYLFRCPRCGFQTKTRYNLKIHYYRNKPCPVTLANVPISELRKSMEIRLNSSTVNQGQRLYPCKGCHKMFSSPQGRYQHRRFCKGAPDPPDPIDTLREEVKILRQEIQDVRQSGWGGRSQFEYNHQHPDNNVTIHAYDRPSLDHLNPAFLTQCIIRRGKGVCELIEQIHFNADVPENHSLRISNRRCNWIETHNGERFELQDKNKVLDELIRQGFEILDEHYNVHEPDIEYALNYNPTRLEEIRKFLEGCRENDISVITPLKKDMFLLILNKQYILFQNHATGDASP